MARTAPDRKRAPAPLDAETLRDLAVRYVARYATTRWKLAAYLGRKLAQRGWEGEGEAPVESVVERCVAAGFVDDAAFAAGRTAALARAGYGVRRRDLALRAVGIEREDRVAAERLLASENGPDPAWTSALAYARRRRLGPWATATPDRDGRRRAIAALVRAGHGFALAARIVDLPAGSSPDDIEP